MPRPTRRVRQRLPRRVEVGEQRAVSARSRLLSQGIVAICERCGIEIEAPLKSQYRKGVA